MVIPMLSGIGGLISRQALAEGISGPTSGVTRQADPSTMDDYVRMLDFEANTRYAGRLWADKSVFAFGVADTNGDRETLWDSNSNVLTLTEALDGVGGKIQLDEDFLHVYSVLGSSLEVVGVPPVRAVIVFDNSGSMYSSNSTGATTVNGKTEYKAGEDLWKLQRISITIEAINRAIDVLMNAGVYNEVAVVLFGDGANGVSNTKSTFAYHGNSSAVTILPMKHYTPNPDKTDGYTHYLSGGWKSADSDMDGDKALHKGSAPSTSESEKGIQEKARSSGWVFVDNQICGLEGFNGCGSYHYTAYSNGTTNIQAGYYVGMQELLGATKSITVGTETYNCVPSLVMLTDGAATDMMQGTYINPDLDTAKTYPLAAGFVNDTGNKLRSFTGYDYANNDKEIRNFWDMFVERGADSRFESVVKPGQYETLQSGAYIPKDAGLTAMQTVANTYSDAVASMLLGTLMTTAYYKAAVANEYKLSGNWDIYTLTVDMLDMKTVPKDAAQDAKNDSSNPAPKTELPKNWQFDINGNAPTVDPANFFNFKDGTVDLNWLLEKGYLDEGFNLTQALQEPGQVIGHTAYPTYSVGEMVIQGIVKAASYLIKWSKSNEGFTTDYQSWQSNSGILSHGTDNKPTRENWNADAYCNPYGHSDGYLLEELQHLTWPQVSADDKYGVVRQDVLDNIAYDTTAYYASTTSGAADDLIGTFEDIVEAITAHLFEPVGGTNGLLVNDAVTYMDPVGKYMDVKDVKALALFGELYPITVTAVYDYRWNHQYMLNEDGKGTDPLPEGWYRGTPENTGTPDGNSKVEFQERSQITDTKKAMAEGWVYRLSFQTASEFVPTLKQINNDNPDEVMTKMRNTEYTFYRLDISESERQELHVNEPYIPSGKTKEDVLKGLTYENHSGKTGVYALADLRIWVEDSGDYNDNVLDDTLTDANFDEALWLSIPVSMLPLRTVSVDLGATIQPDNWPYETNQKVGSKGYTASFPLRLFYTVGVSDDVLGNSNRINIAGSISPEYILQNKITTPEAEEARGIGQGNLEFFSNWYNPLKRYSDYVTSETDFTYGDPMTSFSPTAFDTSGKTDTTQTETRGGNRYYAFEKALPIFYQAYVLKGGTWTRAVIDGDPSTQDLTDVERYTVDDFGGELLAVNLEKVTLTGNKATDSEVIDAALKEKLGETAFKARRKDGCMVLLDANILNDVTKPADSAKTDPFSSDYYYFLPIDYYELNGTTASWRQYAITRKGSEFGSAYKTAGITNGDMLCWHDLSGKYQQDYPYLSYTETLEAGNADPTRGKQFIGAPLENGYYAGCNQSEHKVPSQSNGLADATNVNEEWKQVLDGGDWVVCTKVGGLRVGDLAQNVQNKSGAYSRPEHIMDYVAQRFAGNDEALNLNWGYYANNTTRTANNYYLPTISTTSNTGGNSVIVNVYHGNNGRLWVMDTTLLVTKTVVPPDTMTKVNDKEEFNFQVYIAGTFGKQDAVVVQWNENAQSWQRQFHYIDLELDSQLFLQTQDGVKATVDMDGCRIVSDPSGENYSYADDCTAANGMKHSKGDPYTDTVYYVYMGMNTSDEVGSNVSLTNFRVYHNNLVDEGSVTSKDVLIDGSAGEESTFLASEVWLVPVSTYQSTWVPQTGERLDPTVAGFVLKDEYFYQRLERFPLLTINPNISATTEITITTPYNTASAYWTKTVIFGENANNDGGPGEPGTELTAADLYESSLPTSGLPNYFPSVDNATIAKSTGEFTLRNGQALLFNGLPSATVYRVTEKLTNDQVSAGYRLKQVNHIQQGGTPTTYDPDTQEPYSVYGNTGIYEESVHYVNTMDLERFTLTKDLVDMKNKDILVTPDQEFNFTVVFDPGTNASARDADSTLFYWKGNKDTWESDETWQDAEGNTYQMPKNPPKLEEYKPYLTGDVERLAPMEPVEGMEKTYKVTLKADEAIVFYGLIAGTTYRVTEEKVSHYPLKDDPPDASYTVSGTILRASESPEANDPTDPTVNRADFINQLRTGLLVVEKRLLNEDRDLEKEFTFEVTLSKAPENLADLNAVKYPANSRRGQSVTLDWVPDGKGVKATFNLRHGEKITIDGIPVPSEYYVREIQRDGYNLQHIADNPEDAPTGGKYLPMEADGAKGQFTDEVVQGYLLFANDRAVFPPFSGGMGWTAMYVLGAVLLLVPPVVILYNRRRRKPMG